VADFDAPVDLRFFDEDRTIEWMGAQEFYLRYPVNSRRTTPRSACLIELGPSGTTALRRRIVLGPAPDATYLIPYRYHTTNLAVSSTGAAQRFLSAPTDEPIVPHPYRQGLVFKALEMW